MSPSESLESSTSFIPLPPPPPASQVRMNLETGMLLLFDSNGESNPEKLIDMACNQFWNVFKRVRGAEKEDNDALAVISFYNHVEGVLQSGPTCGLVALIMALKLVKPQLKLDLENVLLQVKQLNMSKFGEMFSVEKMCDLLNTTYGIQAQVKTHLERSILDLVRHLCNGLPVLVPYDADANYEPCLKDGQRAHWATIVGFCFVLDHATASESFPQDGKQSHIDSWHNLDEDRWIVHLKSHESMYNLVKPYIDKHNLFLYARQGKSRRVQVWSFEQLCQSNRNLAQVCSRILNDPERNEMVYPLDGHLTKSLANQFIHVFK